MEIVKTITILQTPGKYTAFLNNDSLCSTDGDSPEALAQLHRSLAALLLNDAAYIENGEQEPSVEETLEQVEKMKQQESEFTRSQEGVE